MLSAVIASMLALSVQDHLEGAEIGDATQFVAFRTGGRYYAERQDKAGKTVATGTWRIKGDTLDVKVSSCKGPACATLKKPWSAKVKLPAERAMTLQSTENAPLATGSYYCRSQGCEKRVGVELVSHARHTDVMRQLLDFLIDSNRTRDVTVVWISDERIAPQKKSAVLWCGREERRAKESAIDVAKDLRTLSWFGQVEPSAGPKDCLYDVRVIVGDEVRAP